MIITSSHPVSNPIQRPLKETVCSKSIMRIKIFLKRYSYYSQNYTAYTLKSKQMQPYSKNRYFTVYKFCLCPHSETDNEHKKKMQRNHKYLLCPTTVKRYVSGQTVLTDYTMQREAEVFSWQLVIGREVSKKKVSKFHPFRFLHATSWCSCHTGASEKLVHCQGNIKHPDRNTKTKKKKT